MPQENLRCHVHGCSTVGLHQHFIVCTLSESEVRKLDDEIFRQENVGKFDVSVDDFSRVKNSHSVTNVVDKLLNGWLW